MADQPLSAKTTISTLTDDDKIALIDAPGSSAAVRLILATDVKTYMQNGVQLTSAKGVANGYAGLDGTGKVPSAQLPALASGVASVNGETGTLTNYQKTTGTGGKGLANGYASLDGSAKVPVAQLPGIVQTASRSTNTTASTVIDFNYQQQTFLVNSTAAFTFSNLTPGAETSATLVMDTGAPFQVTFPGSNFAWDTTVGVINPYPGNVTTIGFQVREDGATVTAFGTPVDRSQIHSPFTEQEIFPREFLGAAGTGNVMSAGQLRWTYFKASRTQLVNNLAMWVRTGSVAATHQFMCIGDVDTSNWTTTIAAITADVTDNSMFGTGTAAGTRTAPALTSAYRVYAGKWYGFGCCSIGHSTSPDVASQRANPAFNTYTDLPMVCASVAQGSYPTVGTSYVAPTVYDTRYYARLV